MKEPSQRRLAPLLAALLLGTCAVAASLYFRPYGSLADPALLAPDNSVMVSSEAYGTVYAPRSGASSLGLAFYPGARVPREAYSYLGQGLARAGYTTVILALPLNFAIFAPAKALKAIQASPGVASWVLGGHSLGGAMAASLAHASPPGVAGLLLLASWPGKSADLSAWGHPVLSISASNDGLATQAKIAASRPLLPGRSRFVEIAGGNHAQFGDYGAQDGDGAASLSESAQRRAVTEETIAFLDSILAGKR